MDNKESPSFYKKIYPVMNYRLSFNQINISLYTHFTFALTYQPYPDKTPPQYMNEVERID
jgi:hypothetical protein